MAPSPDTAPTPDTGLLLHAVHGASDGVLVVDDQGRIVYANAAMTTMAKVDDLVGASIDTLVPPGDRQRHRDLREGYQRRPTARTLQSGIDLRLHRADGTDLPVEIALSPIELDGDYVVAAVRDISERVQAQENLTSAHEQLALVAERERIGRDLHDVVLQHLYGMGLGVQAIAVTNPQLSERLDSVVAEVDDIIAEVRTIVFTLGDSAAHGTLGQELADVVAQARRVLGFTPAIRLDGPVDSVLTLEIRNEMVASMREALGNVARHARASQANVRVTVDDGQVVMVVTDDGVGPPETDEALLGGHGLHNLQQRAEALGGTCVLRPREGGGAELRWSAPFS